MVSRQSKFVGLLKLTVESKKKFFFLTAKVFTESMEVT